MRRRPLLRVDVEPLSGTRWTRLEQALFARLDALPRGVLGEGPKIRARRPVLLAAACCALAAGAGYVSFRVTSGRGPDPLRLATTDSTSQFTVGDSSLTVAPRSVVVVRGDDERGLDVVLDRGAVTCEVAPRRGRPPFRVDAGDVRVRVIGTKFTVAHEAAGTSVDVDHGTVEVTSHGIVTLLHDGGHWPSRIAARPATPPDLAPAPLVPSPAMETSPSSTPPHPPARAASPRTRTEEDPFDLDPDPSLPEAPPALAPVSGPTPQQVFEGAARSERSHPDEAAAAYRQLAVGGSAWAPNALFALARLEADRGRRAEATSLFNAYLARYPRGNNADDARELLKRLR